MGTFVVMAWAENGIDKHLDVIQLYYPTEFSYSQSEIPDGSNPSDLDIKYLPVYKLWMEKLLFMAQKLPTAFMNIHKRHSVESYADLIESLEFGIKTLQNRIELSEKLLAQGIRAHLSVG
jgi:hypothetical protein